MGSSTISGKKSGAYRKKNKSKKKKKMDKWDKISINTAERHNLYHLRMIYES